MRLARSVFRSSARVFIAALEHDLIDAGDFATG